jgi:hypothetical protein
VKNTLTRGKKNWGSKNVLCGAHEVVQKFVVFAKMCVPFVVVVDAAAVFRTEWNASKNFTEELFEIHKFIKREQAE